MGKKQFVEDLNEKDIFVSSIFYVARKELKKTRQNRDYLFLSLKDKTGEISAFLFENVDAFKDKFEEESYIQVEGVTSEYNNNINLRISKIEKVEMEDVDFEDFTKERKIDTDLLFSDTLEFVDKNIENRYIRELIARVLSDIDVVKKIKSHPAAMKMHHALYGGLIEHIYSMLNLGKKIFEHYSSFPTDVNIKINSDVLYAGIIFHDIGKLWELTDKLENYSFSEEGKLLGHISIGYSIVSKYIDQIEGFPEDLKLCILHLILSHHGEREFGSPVTPRTPEAIILHYIDNLDAKLYSIFASKGNSKDVRWTNSQNALRKEIFIGCTDFEEEYMDEDETPF